MLGFPLKLVEQEMPEVGKAITKLPRTAFVQNEFDIVGSAEALRAYLDEIEPPTYQFETIAGNRTHDYLDMQLITNFTKQS